MDYYYYYYLMKARMTNAKYGTRPNLSGAVWTKPEQTTTQYTTVERSHVKKISVEEEEEKENRFEGWKIWL